MLGAVGIGQSTQAELADFCNHAPVRLQQCQAGVICGLSWSLFSPKQQGLGFSPGKTARAGLDWWHADLSWRPWGPAVPDGWHAMRIGAAVLDGWHAGWMGGGEGSCRAPESAETAGSDTTRLRRICVDARHRECRHPRHRDRRGPTQIALMRTRHRDRRRARGQTQSSAGPDTESAGPRHRALEPDTESAGPRHREPCAPIQRPPELDTKNLRK